MKVELTLETVTPLFLTGAPQQTPEFRPASLRGMLRFWLRAVLGGAIGDTNLELLQRLESDVFGVATRGSPVIVRLISPSFVTREVPLLAHKKSALTSAIPPSTSFDLILATRPGVPVEILEIAIWCLLVWLTLGGWGRRSRRGAGSTRISNLKHISGLISNDLLSTLEAATAPAMSGLELANRIEELLQRLTQTFTHFAGADRARFSGVSPSFSILRPETRVVVWTPLDADFRDPNSVLASLMRQMSSLQARLKDDFPKAFGGISPRRASPLLVATHRLQSEWALVFSHLQAEITKSKAGMPAYVDQFLDSLSPIWEVPPRAMTEGRTG